MSMVKETNVGLEVLNFFKDSCEDLVSLNRYPNVKNTPLPSSAAVERLFSFAGMINAPKRSMLSEENFGQLVLMKANS